MVWAEKEIALQLGCRLDKASEKTIIQCKGDKITMIEREFSMKPNGELHKLITEVGHGKLTLAIKNGKPVMIYGLKQEKGENDE
jgi:hypothetical protein